MTWDADGDWFEGSWVNGGRQGPGKLHLASGEIIEQIWDEPADIKGEVLSFVTLLSAISHILLPVRLVISLFGLQL